MSALFAVLKAIAAVCLAGAIFYVMNLAASGLFTNPGLDQPAYVILPDDAPAAAAVEAPSFEELMASADPARGERAFRDCQACHRVEEGVHAVGPSLYGVIGRDIASFDDFRYSAAFSGLEGVWTPERIDALITNPQGFARGTAMTYSGMRRASDRADLIAYLQTLGM
ncbi:c-type cytochrome [Rhodovulum strictum]|uniref:C-type cytochrome n=1 Tax=Rhodovulum strictum TaxID=58314 RepID=A0A844BNM0_9RHOB|nr:c-type cytochrome [Rhodovulum strictum]MRH21567.1 c-type cytochrome [Rhodovulum strictum]